MQLPDFQKQLTAWTQAHPGAFHLHPERGGLRLTEISMGKSLYIDPEQVQTIESKKDWNTGATYLVLSLYSLPPLAVSEAGFVFALNTQNTGELRSAPPSMSFRDFRRLLHHLEHLVEQTATATQRVEALDTAMILIASLDGARLLGLPTESEESELDKLIRKLEAGA